MLTVYKIPSTNKVANTSLPITSYCVSALHLLTVLLSTEPIKYEEGVRPLNVTTSHKKIASKVTRAGT